MWGRHRLPATERFTFDGFRRLHYIGMSIFAGGERRGIPTFVIWE
jgi:hypothetical protein